MPAASLVSPCQPSPPCPQSLSFCSLHPAACPCRADIMPEAQVEALAEMYTAEREERLLGGSPDFVLDAIDNIDTKAR